MCPVIMYGPPIWRTECFSCIQAMHNRAARFFLNVGKYTPVAVDGVQVVEVSFESLVSFIKHGQ